MSFLYFLEDIRTPVGDFLMSTITHLGEETIFVVVALLFLWCIDKNEGYYMLTVGFFGLIANQFLKILCRVPRPWIKDPAFTVVENAIPEATGYSFPSGHTQTAVGAYGTFARWNKQKWVRIICIALCVLIPFSRMYLGMHTPADVLVSTAIALVLIFVLYPFFRNLDKHPNRFFYMLGAFVLLSVAFVIYTEFFVPVGEVDAYNYDSALKNAYNFLGASLGFSLIYFLDVRFYHYETKAPLLAQILKFGFGIALAMSVKIFLKDPLLSLFNGHHAADAVRYFAMFALAGGVGPLFFPHFTRFALFVKEKTARKK